MAKRDTLSNAKQLAADAGMVTLGATGGHIASGIITPFIPGPDIVRKATRIALPLIAGVAMLATRSRALQMAGVGAGTVGLTAFIGAVVAPMLPASFKAKMASAGVPLAGLGVPVAHQVPVYRPAYEDFRPPQLPPMSQLSGLGAADKSVELYDESEYVALIEG